MSVLYKSHADVIATLGITALARALRVNAKRVDGWKVRSSIPGGWFCAVAATAVGAGRPEISVNLLARLADVRAGSDAPPALDPQGVG